MSAAAGRSEIDCCLAGTCSGCPRIGQPLAAQHADKARRLVAQWSDRGLPPAAVAGVEIRPVTAAGLRDRVDLSIRRYDGRLIAGLDGPTPGRVIDIEGCPLLTPALAAWHAEFRERLPDVASAAVRLRVSPTGVRGVWLDVSNADAARLVAEREWLRALSARAVVEIGQRHHRVVDEGDAIALVDAEPRPWFETYVGDDLVATPLFLQIGGFSQPGFDANRVLVREVLAAVAVVGAGRWLELGAGCGNFTIPLVASGAEVTACEIDPRARAGLERSLAAADFDRVDIEVGNFHRPSAELVALLEGHDAVLADPPRSGLMGAATALEAVSAETRPRAILYVSCYARTLVEDAVVLDRLGYRLESIRGVDLFPHSEHCEWVSLFSRQSGTRAVARELPLIQGVGDWW